jgi:nicotinamidase-related amidase
VTLRIPRPARPAHRQPRRGDGTDPGLRCLQHQSQTFRHSDAHLESGSEDWRIVAELTPDDAEPLVEKHYGDSFEDTTLKSVLSGLGVGRLVVVGAQTGAYIRPDAARGARARVRRDYCPRRPHDE